MHTINLMNVESITVFPIDNSSDGETYWRRIYIKCEIGDLEIVLFPKNEETKRLLFEAGEPK